jgi:phosphohistidine phosphatase
MKLYVMRHGPAEDSSASGTDGDRALTTAGRERVRNVAAALLAKDESPLTIISSPLARALQTAEIVAAITRLDERGGTLEVRREVAPGGRNYGLVEQLFATKRRRVMLVGHEPDLSLLVEELLGQAPAQGMQKAMVVGISVSDAPAGAQGRPIATKPRFVLEPKTLTWQQD